MNLDLEHPYFLIGLLLLPLILIMVRFTLVDSPRAQLWVSAATRALVIGLLVSALISLLLVSKSQKVSVLVLADLSDSTPANAYEQVTNLWNTVQAARPASAAAGLQVFSATNTVLVPVANPPAPLPAGFKKAEGSETAMERGLLQAWQGMPSDTVSHILLISDGNQTSGDAVQLARRAAAHGVTVFTMPYAVTARDEVMLEDLQVPSEVKKGQSFVVAAVAHTTKATKAQFVLFRDGFKIQEKEIELKAGPNHLNFQETKAKEGLVKYELRVRCEQDFYADNNVASGLVSVAGEPKILLLEGEERDGRFLSRALEAENIRVDVREGKGMPGSLDELAAYDAVILSDVPATDLNVRQMSLLRSYIEDLGGGFIMLGGQDSFGLGGYYRTSIEEALPVKMRSEKKKDNPGLAMTLVIDRSGSMAGDKLQLAKEAAIAAVELLTDRDHVAVVAFDTEAYVVVDMQSAANKAGINSAIESIAEGGGTSMYPPMVKAHELLQGIPAALKHCVVLTDGVSQPGDFQGITSTMVSELITVSSVAVGEDIDSELLQNIARWGKGRFYQTSDPNDIPQIFTKETMTASKSSLVEEPFLPQVLRDDPAVRGIDWNNAPFLFGYVVTAPKPTASVSLLTERGDPLLATWQFGLGKSAAFMSDAKSRWAADWVRWPGYGQFWSQLVRSVMRTSQNQGAETRITLLGDTAKLEVDTLDAGGTFINSLDSMAQLILPDLTVNSLPLRQTAPGHYEAEFPAKAMGSYLLKIKQSKKNSTGESEVMNDYTRALTISYKPEYRHLSPNEDLLREIATSTGGKYQPQAAEIFQVAPEKAMPVRKRIWPWLLAAALILFVVDVGLRRLDLAGIRFLPDSTQRYG